MAGPGGKFRSDEDIRIVAFLCNWCSYAGADLAGTSRLQYPPNIRVIRVPCSGRINPVYIIKALMEGADGVMVSGCHPGDCHYLSGNLYARRRFVVLKKLLQTCGIDPERVQFTWVSASEGGRFAEVVTEVTEKIVKLGPSQVGARGDRGTYNLSPGELAEGAGWDGCEVIRPPVTLDARTPDTNVTHDEPDGDDAE